MKTNPIDKRVKEDDRAANLIFWTMEGGLILIWIGVLLWMLHQGQA